MSSTAPSPSAPYELPRCELCGKAMMLARIEPSSPGVDHRTFECGCGHIEMLLVKHK